jgi:exosortase
MASSNPMRGRIRRLELLGLFCASIAIWWNPLATDMKLALSSDAHTHILLILPLSVALIYFQARGAHLACERERWLGLMLLSAALVLRGFTRWDVWPLSPSGRLSLSIFALVMWWIGSVILCLGLRTFRSFLFPLCFLFLITPFPEHVLNWITEFLQQQTAVAAGALFRIARVPVTREGIMLSIPGLDIEVASECSSIRSSMMLLVTTLLLAQLFLRSRWRKILLLVAVIPLSVAKNALRVFTITELGTRVDPGFLDGWLHHSGGIVFFGLTVLVVAMLVWLLRRGELRASGISGMS